MNAVKVGIAVCVLLIIMMVGCSSMVRVSTGEVGVRTTFSKEVKLEELKQGIHFAVFETITVYNVKETTLDMKGLTPKAADNLYLARLNIQIRYNINPDKVADQVVSVAGQSAHDQETGEQYPSYYLVKAHANGIINDTIDKYPSLTVQSKRPEIEARIKQKLQEELTVAWPGTFTINSVIIGEVDTDPTIEQSIQAAVQMEKQVEKKKNELELAKAQAAIQITQSEAFAKAKIIEADGVAKANDTIAKSLNEKVLAWEQMQVQKKFAGEGTHTVLMNGDAKANILVGK